MLNNIGNNISGGLASQMKRGRRVLGDKLLRALAQSSWIRLHTSTPTIRMRSVDQTIVNGCSAEDNCVVWLK